MATLGGNEAAGLYGPIDVSAAATWPDGGAPSLPPVEAAAAAKRSRPETAAGADVNVGSGGSCAQGLACPLTSVGGHLCGASITIICVAMVLWPPLHFNLFVYYFICFFRLFIISLFAQVACARMAPIECVSAALTALTECAPAALIGCAALAPPLPVRAASTTRHEHECGPPCLSRTVPAACPVLGSYANAPGGGLRGVAVDGTPIRTRANTHVVCICVYIYLYLYYY